MGIIMQYTKVLVALVVVCAMASAFEPEEFVNPLEDLSFIQVGKGGTATAKKAKTAAKEAVKAAAKAKDQVAKSKAAAKAKIADKAKSSAKRNKEKAKALKQTVEKLKAKGA